MGRACGTYGAGPLVGKPDVRELEDIDIDKMII
jgi:hypothetical protein